MGNFADCFLVKLCPENDLISLTTYDIFHGKSCRFLMMKSKLEEMLLPDAQPILDTDIGSYLQLRRKRNAVQFDLTWLNHSFRNDVQGYVLSFSISFEKIESLLEGRKVHHIECTTNGPAKAELFLTDSCHQVLRGYCKDKLTRHALRRFFRDNLNYGDDETLVIHPDSWVDGFYFQSTCTGYAGGIVRHEGVVTGKDGREYKKVFYAVHT